MHSTHSCTLIPTMMHTDAHVPSHTHTCATQHGRHGWPGVASVDGAVAWAVTALPPGAVGSVLYQLVRGSHVTAPPRHLPNEGRGENRYKTPEQGWGQHRHSSFGKRSTNTWVCERTRGSGSLVYLHWPRVRGTRLNQELCTRSQHGQRQGTIQKDLGGRAGRGGGLRTEGSKCVASAGTQGEKPEGQGSPRSAARMM